MFLILYVQGFIYMYATTKRSLVIACFQGEESFVDPKSDSRVEFPSVLDSATVDLSVIIPAYNEEERSRLSIAYYRLIFFYILQSTSFQHFSYKVLNRNSFH